MTACPSATRSIAPSASAQHRVPGDQLAAAAGHRPPARPGLRGVRRLADQLAADVQHRVAADHDRVRTVVGDPAGHRGGLGRGQRGDLGRRAWRPAWRRAAPSSSKSDTSTSGSSPAARSTASRAGEAEASTTRTRRDPMSGRPRARVAPRHGARHAVRRPRSMGRAAAVPPAAARGRPVLSGARRRRARRRGRGAAGRAAGPAGSDQRSTTPRARRTRRRRPPRRRPAPRVSAATSSSDGSPRTTRNSARRSSGVAVAAHVRGIRAHSGMFPCLRAGPASRLVASMRSARPT